MPNVIGPGADSAHELIVGIDLGTTNSLVAVCENGKPRILESFDGTRIVPSVIHWDDNAKVPVVGRAAKRLRITDAPHTVYSVKRFMGKGKKDLSPSALTTIDTSSSTDQNVLIKIGKRSLSPIELSAEILKSLRQIAESALGQSVRKAVITVPAYFNDSQRTATKTAGQLAGLEVLRIVNEPTAAALAYGLDRKQNGTIAVYDLGGGTFDVSILKLQNGIFEVLATNGDTALGGDDFDRALADLILTKLVNVPQVATDKASLDLKALLLETAENVKIQLGQQKTAEAKFTWKGHEAKTTVSRDEFETAIMPFIERTIDITKAAMADAALTKSEVDDIVMVGGSTRVPLVRKAVQNFFSKELNVGVNPDEVVALGAAIQADILAGHNKDTVLLDVVPLSLGIETYGGTAGKIIHRNTKIPAVAQEMFTTHVDGQRNVLIHVLQGERELAADCRSLARFDLRGLPALPAGLPRIQVTFLVDANGILTVRAQELATKTEASVEVKPTYGLTDDEVEKMLSDSFEHAEEDIRNRQLIDTRLQADGIIKAAERILSQVEEAATPGETSAVRAQVKIVKDLMTGTDYVAIKNGIEALEISAKPLAEKLMHKTVAESLTNKKVDEVLRPKS